MPCTRIDVSILTASSRPGMLGSERESISPNVAQQWNTSASSPAVSDSKASACPRLAGCHRLPCVPGTTCPGRAQHPGHLLLHRASGREAGARGLRWGREGGARLLWHTRGLGNLAGVWPRESLPHSRLERGALTQLPAPNLCPPPLIFLAWGGAVGPGDRPGVCESGAGGLAPEIPRLPVFYPAAHASSFIRGWAAWRSRAGVWRWREGPSRPALSPSSPVRCLVAGGSRAFLWFS